MLLLVNIFISIGVSIRITRNALAEQLTSDLVSHTDTNTILLQSYLNQVRNTAINLAIIAETATFAEENVHDTIKKIINRNYYIHGISVAYEPYQFKPFTKNWAVHYHWTAEEKLELVEIGNDNYFETDWYAIAKENRRPVLSPPHQEKEDFVHVVTWSAPFFDDDENVKGVIAIDISLIELNETVRGINVGQRGYAFLINKQGIILGIGENTGKHQYLIEDGLQTFQAVKSTGWQGLISEMQTGQGGFAKVTDAQHVPVFVAYRPIGLDTGLSLGLAFPESEIFQPANELRSILLIVAIVTIIISGISLYWFTDNQIGKPLTLLANYTRRFSRGDLRLDAGKQIRPIIIETKDELEELANAFNQMSAELSQTFASLHEHSEELARKNEALQHMDKLKDEFLANTSHELRTPLNGIIGIVDSMLAGAAGKLTKIQEKNLSMVTASGHRLTNLINDILDFSKLRHQDLVLHLKPMHLRPIAEVVLNLSEMLVDTKPVTLTNSVDPELPLVEIDENRVKQILHNLVDNAIKFTHEGQVEISAHVEKEYMVVTVSDTGIGISADKLESIFGAFEQGDSSIDRIYGGTGLGLAITKYLVELHGGKVTVESELEQGSQFIFSLLVSDEIPKEIEITSEVLPVSHTTAYIDIVGDDIEDDIENELPIEDINLTPAEDVEFHILVVDDEPINIQVLTNQLSLQKYNVTSASSGMEALELINEQPDPFFDLVVLDVMMPRMSGYEVCHEIRQRYPVNELPVIMLTAKHHIMDLVAGFNAGANDYLAKPFSRLELLLRIRTHLQLTNLREINASKDRFFSIVAHDLKGPFQPVLGFSQLLAEMASEFSQEEIEEMCTNINKSAQGVYDLLENLLQWSRVERGRMPYDPMVIDLQSMTQSIFNLLEANATSKNVSFHNQVEPSMRVYADENMLKTVIRNLTTNALKFTPNDGSITISSILHEAETNSDNTPPESTMLSQYTDGNVVEVSVADTGVGINEENLSKLFRIDQNVTTLGTEKEKGTGLGLIICQEMVRKNGGKIWIESELGKGTTVKFTVPMFNDSAELEFLAELGLEG